MERLFLAYVGRLVVRRKTQRRAARRKAARSAARSKLRGPRSTVAWYGKRAHKRGTR